MSLVELTVFLAVAIVVAALFASIFLVIWRRGAAPTPDHVPIRLGVILLGAIGLTCIGGLFYLSNTPDLSKGSDQSSGTAQTPGEMGLLQAQAQQGVTESVVTSTNEVVKNASTDASTLGVSNQIVGLLGTIAGASVAGIAGLLVGPGRTEQPPSSDGEGTGGGRTSPPTSPTDLLLVWARLRDEGIITDSDFDRMKERILLEEEQKISSASKQEDLLSPIQGLHAAWNAGDEETILGFFTDNATVTVTPTTSAPPQTYVGKERIRTDFVRPYMHSFQVDSRNYRQDANRMLWESTVSAEKFRQSGINPVEGTAVATFEGETIASLTFTFSPATQQRMQAVNRTPP